MRTNIEIDDKLMKQAMKASGAKTKKAAVDTALRMMLKSHEQKGIRALFGKVQWEGDLQASRLGDKWFGTPGTWPVDETMPRPQQYLERPAKARGKKAA
jgi:Arc/MetJ family transcription regulator